MIDATPRFRIIKKEIQGNNNHDGDLLGIVKVQMPEQCESSRWFRIANNERERNLRIVDSVVSAFGSWSKTVEAPAIILFPEFSVSKEASDLLIQKMATEDIVPNTMIVFGMEQIDRNEFLSRIAQSDSCNEFNDDLLGVNIDRINTAVILVKDDYGNSHCYYQPKCTRSDYESPRQFRSNLVYKFTFGMNHLLVSICSDFILSEPEGVVVGSVMQDIDRLYSNPRDKRLDIICLIQKNPAPFHPLYEESIKHLFFNRQHRLQTTDTIVCAVNSANEKIPIKYGNCNVSLMRRGRPASHFKTRPAREHYAWCSFSRDTSREIDDLHYIRWRMRCPGLISFVLETSNRPWRLGDTNSIPVRKVGLFQISENCDLEEICPIPEVYEMKETLFNRFGAFIEDVFRSSVLKTYFGPIDEYENLLDDLFDRSPQSIIELLFSLHDCDVINCDHWKLSSIRDVFKHFILSLRLLSECYADLKIENGQLYGSFITYGVLDCNNSSVFTVLKKHIEIVSRLEDTSILLLQRTEDVSPFWDGSMVPIDELINKISVSSAKADESKQFSIAKAPSPYLVNLSSVLQTLNKQCESASDIRRVLHACLQSK